MQVALAYTLCQDFDSLGVCWSANEHELAETLTAVDLVLSPAQIAFLEAGTEGAALSGAPGPSVQGHLRDQPASTQSISPLM